MSLNDAVLLQTAEEVQERFTNAPLRTDCASCSRNTQGNDPLTFCVGKYAIVYSMINCMAYSHMLHNICNATMHYIIGFKTHNLLLSKHLIQ